MKIDHAKHKVLIVAGRRRRVVACGVLIMLGGAIAVLACSWSYVTDHSVRFNSFRTGRGFYRLPPLPIMYDPVTGKEIAVVDRLESESTEEEQYENEQLKSGVSVEAEMPADVWAQIDAALQAANLLDVEQLLRKYLEMTTYETWDDEPERQFRRNLACDMLDAMTALKQGSKADMVKVYLQARYFDDPDLNADEDATTRSKADRNLKDNWDYLSAASLYSQAAPIHSIEKKQEARQAFWDHIANYPGSEKNEAAVYMFAKIHLELSHSFENTGCGIEGKKPYGGDVKPDEIEPAEKCRDESWYSAIETFQALMAKHPNGKYFNDARSWLAYLFYRGGERARALAEYYRLLGHSTDRAVRLKAKKSLQIIGHEYTDETLDDLERQIAGEPATAMAYSYHRIYNHATDLTYQKVESWYRSNYTEYRDEIDRVSEANKTGNHELGRVARFATSMMKRYPQAQVSGGFVLRVAEAQLELQNFGDAHVLARKALALGLTGELRAQALWTKGSAEHQCKDYRTARVTFMQLIAEFPKAKLTEGARRLLALTAEDEGDLETALEQYLALKYDYDVAYFVDVLLPVERLAAFVKAHRNDPQHDQLLYALGVRYMRDKRWNDARAVLLQVRTASAPTMENLGTGDGRRLFAKEPDWDWKPGFGIKNSWVMQDLKTIDVLEHLEQMIVTAEGDEAKAAAMYQLASYHFDADALLFYNPAAWQGQRSELLYQLDTSDNVRQPNESQIIFDYSQTHETLARAIPIYLDLVNKYPQTKPAGDALFSAAVADERLADLNLYWREIYGRGLFAGSQPVSFADLNRLYPKYRWPKSRNGWEASTRTINGGPAWAPPPKPPKPAPKLTHEQKIRATVDRLYKEFQPKVEQKVDAVVGRVDSSLQAIFDAALAMIALLLGCYGFLLWVHFCRPEWLARPDERSVLTEADLHPLQLPHTQSRVDEVIGKS